MRTPLPPGQAGGRSHFRRGIIADDLTGACDTGAAFAERGFSTVVALNRRAPLPGSAQVVVLTTNSRNVPVRSAQRKVRQACAYLTRARIPILYKKIDSTLKGNVQAEIANLMKAAGFSRALVCPAFPRQGRSVRGGILYVHGKPFADLSFCLGGRPDFRIASVLQPISPKKLAKALRRGSPCVIPDARTERDLSGLVRTAAKSRARVLLVGSAGMARHLAEDLRRKQRGQGRPRSVLRLTNQAAYPLIFSGSDNPVTQNQIDALLRSKRAVACSLQSRLTNRAIKTNVQRQAIVLRVPTHRVSNRTLSRSFAPLESIFSGNAIPGLVLIGGDTALLITQWLRAKAIAIRGEICPGIPWGQIIGGQADGALLCTKAGGFGKSNTLIQVVDFLTNKARTAG